MLAAGRPDDDDDARRRIHFSVNDVSVDSKSTDSFMFILDAFYDDAASSLPSVTIPYPTKRR